MAKDEKKLELVAETSMPTLLDGAPIEVRLETPPPVEVPPAETPPAGETAEVDDGKDTVDAWAVACRHVDTYSPDRVPRAIDPTQQKAFVLRMVKAHFRVELDGEPRVSREKYEEMVEAVMGLKVGHGLIGAKE